MALWAGISVASVADAFGVTAPPAVSRRPGTEVVNSPEQQAAATRSPVDEPALAGVTERYFEGGKEAVAAAEVCDGEYRRRLTEVTDSLLRPDSRVRQARTGPHRAGIRGAQGVPESPGSPGSPGALPSLDHGGFDADRTGTRGVRAAEVPR